MGKAPLDYINAAIQTKSDQFHGELVSASHVQAVVVGCIAYLQELDKIKKALFYGREFEHPNVDGESVEQVQLFASLGGNREQDIDVVHAILGKATEAGELLEALKLGMDGQALDRTNLMEELGDGQWYDAILAKALGFTFEEVQEINIDKLRTRFPDKFTEFDAQNRDLVKERSALEQKSPEAAAIIDPAKIAAATEAKAETPAPATPPAAPKAPKAK